jgi:hypothetical protein
VNIPSQEIRRHALFQHCGIIPAGYYSLGAAYRAEAHDEQYRYDEREYHDRFRDDQEQQHVARDLLFFGNGADARSADAALRHARSYASADYRDCSAYRKQSGSYIHHTPPPSIIF